LSNDIKRFPAKPGQLEINRKQSDFGFEVEKQAEIEGIGMGVFRDGTPFLNQRGLARLCGVENAHIGTISSQWNDAELKPRVAKIKEMLASVGVELASPHIEATFEGKPMFAYPAPVCLAILEYYVIDAGANIQPQARQNYRRLAGHGLEDFIYSHIGYDPTGKHSDKFAKWHDRIALNYQSAPRGFFHVFNEAHTVIYELIIAGAVIDEKMVVDISIGQHWSKYWDGSGFNERFGDRNKYPHRYPDDHPQSKSNPQESWCYPLEALGEYRRWLQDDYIDGGRFRGYLSGKVARGELAPSFAELALEALEQKQIGH
jgi:hypothetical protein